MSNLEQTLSIIKPDAVERNLEDKIKTMFKNEGFKIVKEKNHDKKKPSDFIANINKKSFFFKSFISFLKKSNFETKSEKVGYIKFSKNFSSIIFSQIKNFFYKYSHFYSIIYWNLVKIRQ